MTNKKISRLTGQVLDKLIINASERRTRQAEQRRNDEALSYASSDSAEVPEQFYRFDLHPGYQQMRMMNEGAAKLGITSPFFKLHEGIAGATSRIDGREYINYASYNYLALSGCAEVSAAAKTAIDHYGTSASASRIVSGERPIHQALESAIANAYEVDDALVFVSGHATNVTAIGYLFGSKDLILHDEYVHNSILQGITLSGAKRLPFPHNDWAALDAVLALQRRHFERVLIVLEGIYSMDGDYPDLPKFVEIKHRHKAFLMVDEAHSFGVMGKTGLGIREHFNLPGSDVDIWMGTLSKALAACGGYIAGETALVEHLKFLAPGFLYSVGMPPSVAAAALAALTVLRQEPERVALLQQRGQFFLQQAKLTGIDVGSSQGLAIIPAITTSSIKAARLSTALFAHGINVQPILYPAVAEKSARLRFFVSCFHTEEQICYTMQMLGKEMARL